HISSCFSQRKHCYVTHFLYVLIDLNRLPELDTFDYFGKFRLIFIAVTDTNIESFSNRSRKHIHSFKLEILIPSEHSRNVCLGNFKPLSNVNILQTLTDHHSLDIESKRGSPSRSKNFNIFLKLAGDFIVIHDEPQFTGPIILVSSIDFITTSA